MNIIKYARNRIDAILHFLGIGGKKTQVGTVVPAEEAQLQPEHESFGDGTPELVSSEEATKEVPRPPESDDTKEVQPESKPSSAITQTPSLVLEPVLEVEAQTTGQSAEEEATPIAEPTQPPPLEFKDSPEKKALDELILETLDEFQEKELAEENQLLLSRYVQFFEKKNHSTLKAAIKQALVKCGLPPNTAKANVYLSEVPGIEVFEQGLNTFICLRGTRGALKKREAPETSKAASVDEKEIPPLDTLLGGICKYAAWDGENARNMLASVKRQLKTYYPESIDEGERSEQRGIRFKQIMVEAYNAGLQKKPFAQIREMLKSSELYWPANEKRARKQYDSGVAANRRWAEANALKLQSKKQSSRLAKNQIVGTASISDAFDTMFNAAPAAQPSTNVSPLAEIRDGKANVLTTLPSSEEWTVVIDDTGRDYSSTARGNSRGRLVALFVPKERPLTDLPRRWHACEKSLKGPEGILDVVKRIQTAKCGLLGIPITALPDTTRQDRWFSCLEELIALSLRLLKIEGKTNISVFVEEREEAEGAVGTAMLNKTITDILHHLALVFPERARKITINGQIIAKDNHPWNGYADAAAFLWGSPTQQFILKETGWLGSCFLEQESADLLRRTRDAFRSEGVPDAQNWKNLLALTDADNEASLVKALLDALGQEAKENVEIWKTFLDEARRHLDSKAIRMSLLARQLEWLEQWEPDGASMPPRMRLAWLVAKLATANHEGRTDLHELDAFRKEFDELVERLHRESCPLCTFANLHLAVSYTNAFEFEKARALLLPMLEWPVEGMGLLMRGRLLSSLGQHEAFLGNPAGALPLFDEAISLFGELSEGASGEIKKTRAYAATAAGDAKTPEADERLAVYLWNGPFSEERFTTESRRLATSADPNDDYAHHILLRKLVGLPEIHPARVAYLSQKDKWSEPVVGHPWELIEFYRALLLPAGNERGIRLERAYNLALADNSGQTLQVIAAVIQGSAFCFDDAKTDREGYGDLVACCEEAIPALGDTRLAALRGQLDSSTRLAPLDLARKVLPFNFR